MLEAVDCWLAAAGSGSGRWGLQPHSHCSLPTHYLLHQLSAYCWQQPPSGSRILHGRVVMCKACRIAQPQRAGCAIAEDLVSLAAKRRWGARSEAASIIRGCSFKQEGHQQTSPAASLPGWQPSSSGGYSRSVQGLPPIKVAIDRGCVELRHCKSMPAAAFLGTTQQPSDLEAG